MTGVFWALVWTCIHRCPSSLVPDLIFYNEAFTGRVIARCHYRYQDDRTTKQCLLNPNPQLSRGGPGCRTLARDKPPTDRSQLHLLPITPNPWTPPWTSHLTPLAGYLGEDNYSIFFFFGVFHLRRMGEGEREGGGGGGVVTG